MAIDVDTFLASRPDGLDVLALGEPTHGEPAFPRLRNHVFERLVARGFRSIAVESDRIAGLAVDDYVRDGVGGLDDVLATGFSHRGGELAANRELVQWMRTHNAAVPAGERLSFHGFDAPLEMISAPSPGPYLRHLRDFLAAELGADALPPRSGDLEALAGDDARWSDTAALMDPARSPGRTGDAATLRVLADDLLTTLDVHAARLGPARRRARLHGTAALGLLRYHAVAADPAPEARRVSHLLGVRDAWMAHNLLDIRAQEYRRGPTLLFAHNRHLQRHPSTWRLAGMDLEWGSAGAGIAAELGSRYAFLAGSLGASRALGLDGPAADTIEGMLAASAAGQGPIVERTRLTRPAAGAASRAGVTPEQGYFPLDAATVEHCDGVWHVDRFPAAAVAAAARIAALPGVFQQDAGPDDGAPEVAWDERFFFVGPDRRRPFASIVGHDIPGFDEASRLDRIGVFRLNIELGRARFEALFGYPPRDAEDHRGEVDFAAEDELFPHPQYALHGWAGVINPGPRTQGLVDELIAHAHGRAADRDRRRAASG
ncbi:erythromycin esterase family protein [Dactylosporangium matsuzakiense]|uniref:erythromycin esterase family protein n=1 Tax=Dactylosporangium matsuzakiense TaxID=53360 RepID=UPI0021C28F07|nr:erythromycin esterase family protein [Dactylosporangium matsuzakiense]UWZ40941.1 erythromycin esterase family protein [Dactylosporangium matsuzakiense]